MEKLMEISADEIRKLFGSHDRYLEKIEKELNVILVNRNGVLKIVGDETNVNGAASMIGELMGTLDKNGDIEEQKIDYAISLTRENNERVLSEIDKEVICHTISGKPIKPKTVGQKNYVDAIKKDMVVFGIGPAGTVKT